MWLRLVFFKTSLPVLNDFMHVSSYFPRELYRSMSQKKIRQYNVINDTNFIPNFARLLITFKNNVYNIC